jgi:cell division protein ZapE
MARRDGPATHRGVAEEFDHRVEQGRIRADAAQRRAAERLDRLIDDIQSKRLASKSSALGWLFARRKTAGEPVKGLYLHGGVGRGKTMLMDMFFALAPVRRKRRVHFNAFMADVHDRIGRHRQALKERRARGDDPIPPVAAALVDEAWVLCLDEFSVTDIADAMILSRLFSALFEKGLVLVATSNVAPDDLYRDGLNRGLFLPFIDILKRHVDIMMLDSGVDYRLEKLSHLPVYAWPADAEADRLMDKAWAVLANGHEERETELTIKGRTLRIPRAAGRAARFSFADLCQRPLGARDYLALADRFDALVIDHIPVLHEAQRNEAKRFILLIDTLYDHGIRLFASAEAPPDALYHGRAGAEALEFARTASRLFEMQGRDWPARRHGREGTMAENVKAG